MHPVDTLRWWDYLLWIILALWLGSRLAFLYLARDMPEELQRIYRSLAGWIVVTALYCFGRFYS